MFGQIGGYAKVSLMGKIEMGVTPTQTTVHTVGTGFKPALPLSSLPPRRGKARMEVLPPLTLSLSKGRALPQQTNPSFPPPLRHSGESRNPVPSPLAKRILRSARPPPQPRPIPKPHPPPDPRPPNRPQPPTIQAGLRIIPQHKPFILPHLPLQLPNLIPLPLIPARVHNHPPFYQPDPLPRQCRHPLQHQPVLHARMREHHHVPPPQLPRVVAAPDDNQIPRAKTRLHAPTLHPIHPNPPQPSQKPNPRQPIKQTHIRNKPPTKIPPSLRSP